MNWYRFLLVKWLMTDALLFIVAYCLAYFLRVGFILSSDYQFGVLLLIAALTVPFLLVSLVTTRVFALSRRQYTVRNALYIGYACFMSAALFTLINYAYFKISVSRLLLMYAIILSFVLLWFWHIGFERFLRWFLVRRRYFKALIIGDTRESNVLIERMINSNNPLVPVAVLDGRGTKAMHIHGVPVLGKLNKLDEVLQKEGITHLIQCSDLEQSLNLLSACRTANITYMLLPSVLGIVERDERIESLEGQPVTQVSPKQQVFTWFFR